MVEDGESWGETRKELLETLGEVLDVSLRKFAMITVRNRDRQAWGRLIVSSVSEASRILKDVQLEDLLKRVEALEEGRGGRN